MRAFLRRCVAMALVPALLTSSLAEAATPTALPYTAINAIPPNAQSAAPLPLIMLNMSKDHQLFYRAYNEFSDYNGDGVPDGTYLHTVQYAGYFDSRKCYEYKDADKLFSPTGDVSGDNVCSSAWHGNFLNWATMTRMDVLRKVLYGGYRSTDWKKINDEAQTILERASLPMDAHSFAKYYGNATTPTADRPNISAITPFTGITELTFCNTTLGDNGVWSQSNTNPPLLRATSGNYSLWNAHARRQCRWNEELQWGPNTKTQSDEDGRDNGNDPNVTGLGALKDYPTRKKTALPKDSDNGDFVVRVQVCKAGMIGSERCRVYPSGNRQPIGLLQEYGEQDLAEFGLLTGSFSNNISGGVLRKAVGSFRKEVNHETDGSFVRDLKTTGKEPGIVDTIDRIKIYGYRYTDGVYEGDGNCTFQITSLRDGQCASWGNPIGEMFIETLRYLRGPPKDSGAYGPSAAYGGGKDAKGSEMGLPALADWVDPLNRGDDITKAFGRPQCRPISVINFNASVTSYDSDTLGPFADMGAAGSLDSYTDAVGTGEDITNTPRFIGRTPTDANSLCTAKTVSKLSAVDGICPIAPAYRGSYSLAGAAYWANTHPVRKVPDGMSPEDTQRAYRVRTYGVALAPGVPRITVQAGKATAIIQPAYRLQLPNGGGVASGSLVDFRVISQTDTGGSYLVIWEDSEQGGDFDQDVSGILTWSLSGTKLTVTTQVISESTDNAQGFGYVISGTSTGTSGASGDGVHFHSGIEKFSYTDPVPIKVTTVDGKTHPRIGDTGGCNECRADQVASMATYAVTGKVGGVLEDPMWYAAKWGGFHDAKGIASGTPNATGLWDAINNTTGASGPDGVPDNYFEVFNPSQLEQSLRRVLQDAAVESNAPPAVSSSQLISGGLKYVASFDPKRQNGNIRAYEVDRDGNFPSTAKWSVGEQLTAKPASGADARQIITNSQTTGFAFDWTNVGSGQFRGYRALLKSGRNSIDNAQAQRVVRFVRGDRGVEGADGIRNRDPTNILGPVVNAAPWAQPRPSARLLSTQHPGYAKFVADYKDRPKLLWVAAGDGMLHAFNASTGASIMSYVPEALVPRLKDVAIGPAAVQAFVDGSPFSADVDISAGVPSAPNGPTWRTYVFGSLGRGGNGIFALDATNVTALASAESRAAEIFKWQFTSEDDPDLGHLLSDISIEPGTGQAAPVVKLPDGRFALVFGNGYGSQDGKAALFIVPVQGPNSAGSWTGRYYKIVLDNGAGNGLSTATPLDTNNDGRADTVYAGDQKGNLWKINIGSTTPSEWGSAYQSNGSPTPLYVATAADGTTGLPITGAPQFSFPKVGGVMVSFGTGMSVLPGDFPKPSVAQRVYGIWDRAAFASSVRALPRGTTTLAARTLSRLSNGNVVVTGATELDLVNLNAANAHDGWYFELPGNAEMVLSNLEFRAGSIFFTTVRPAPGVTCTNMPRAAFYLLDPSSGLAKLSVQGTATVDGTVVALMATDVADQKVRVVGDSSYRRTPAAEGQSPGSGALVCPDGTAAFRIIGETTDTSLCFQQSNARFQWREIPGLRTK